MKIVLYKLTDKSTNFTTCTRNPNITKRITGPDLHFTGETRFIKGDCAYHSVIYENDSFKLEILEVVK